MNVYDHHIVEGPYNSYSIRVSPDVIELALRQKDMTAEKLKEIWDLDIKDATKVFDLAVSTIAAEEAKKKAEAEAQKRKNKDNDAAWDLVKGLITALAPDDETKDSFHEHEDDFHDLFTEMAKAFDNVLRNSRSGDPYNDFKRAAYLDPRADVVPTTITTAISDSLGRKDDVPRVTFKHDGDCTTATYTTPFGSEKGTITTNDKEYLREWLRKHGLK